VERKEDGDTLWLRDLFSSFDCSQHNHVPTYTRGGTLDHIYTRSDDNVVNLNVDPTGIISDHSFISWQQLFTSPQAASSKKSTRCWKKMDRLKFRQALIDSFLCAKVSDELSSVQLFDIYDETLRGLVDRFAPVKTVTIRLNPIAV